ncbi:hypothetical protein BT96DRAFT_970756 [Gymnopus androsaceus JB14]|uniref:CWH43-like N-terminal domain-containing protein n=1 Tax=Gymnopus androsaceus JB14 TaxID=1447944 RepID=A0A6A4IGT0_9AGAR|nr:hypothetical protein BT96DRAFT_970756 [Gymnopus androsaceus JB14]
MAIFSHQRHHWAYVWIPIVGAFVWFFTLWALIITWLATGKPHYSSMTSDQTIAYISDVAADFLKPLFIVACSITAVSFILDLIFERYLRHSGRLMPNMRHTGTRPRCFLLVFIVGVALSAIFTIVEFRWISKDFGEIRLLKTSYWMKAIIAGLLIIAAIAFAATRFVVVNVGAVIEWVIAFGYTFYLLTFYYDLRQSKGVHKGELSADRINNSERYRMRQVV